MSVEVRRCKNMIMYNAKVNSRNKMMDLMLVEIDILEYMHDANKVKGLGSEV